MEEKIKDLGTLQGPVLVFGGVYSNLEALLALKEIADKKNINPQNIICTGDIIGYCANPLECMQIIKEWGIHTIVGNVEIQLREDRDDCGCDFTEGGRCDAFSQQWYPFAKNQLSSTDGVWLNSLPEFITFNYEGKKVFVLHGSYHKTAEFIFKSTPWDTKIKSLTDTQTDIILAGHSGIPFVDTKKGKTWFNAGVIGMPANDGNKNVWFGIMDHKNDSITFKHESYAYDFHTASEKMTSNNLPASYAKTLKTGIWDNCEILPDVETEQQGKPLVF